MEHPLHFVAGRELTHLYLRPGEAIRTPLIALLFWQGSDLIRSQNLWRRWMVAHNLPRPGGKLPEPILPAYTGRWFEEMGTATEENQVAFIERYREEGIRLDYWWMDAGWYPCFINGKNSWPMTGTWEPDPKRFPRVFEQVPAEVWQQDWVVRCQPVGSGERSLKYLAPYIFRVAISNSRIVKLENGQVTFRYRSATKRTYKYCTLPAEEFIRRFLQHVLPRGFVKVRYYGLFSPAYRPVLRRRNCACG